MQLQVAQKTEFPPPIREQPIRICDSVTVRILDGPAPYYPTDKDMLLSSIEMAYRKALRYALRANGLPADHPLSVILNDRLEVAHDRGIPFSEIETVIKSVEPPRY